jgi:hypothetical protein
VATSPGELEWIQGLEPQAKELAPERGPFLFLLVLLHQGNCPHGVGLNLFAHLVQQVGLNW